jgi:hypothetical protein
MNFFYLFIFIVFLSCSNTKKIYVCGDHTCIDKKESKEYFVENLIVEIIKDKSKKKTSVDLVELNTRGFEKKKDIIIDLNYNEKLSKKELKVLNKEKKKKLRADRKRKKIEENNKAKEDKNLTMLSKKIKKNVIFDNINNKKKNQVLLKPIQPLNENGTQLKKKKSNQMKPFESVRSKKQLSICDKVKDCDIDKIAEILINKGSKKSFPDISLK